MKKFIFPLLLGIIFALSAVVRVHPIFTNSFAFTYDVGRDMLNVAQIVNQHKIPLIGPTTGLPGLFYGPWWYYFLVPAFFLGEGNPQAIALFMSFIGLGTMLVVYLLGKYVKDDILGIFFSGLVGFSAVPIFLSIQIWNPNMAQLFISLVLLTVVNIKKRLLSMWEYFSLGLLLGLTIDSEVVFGLLFLSGIIVASVFLLRKRIQKKGMLYSLLGILVIFSPRILFEIRHRFVMTTHIFQMLGNGSDGGSLSLPTLLSQRIWFFWDTWNWSFGHIVPLSIVALCAVFVYVSLTIKNKEQTLSAFLSQFLLIVSIVFFVGLLFFKHDIFSHYVVALPVYFLLLAGMSIYSLASKYVKPTITTCFMMLFLLVLMNPIPAWADIFGPKWVGDPSVYRNQLNVIDYVYQESQGKEFKYVTYTPAVIDYPYQYLFAWYGPKKYHYGPTRQAKLMFFILEPNTQFPDLRVKWLSERSRDGKVIKETTLPGGITVQTRVQ